jgi:hypothetical protein
MPRLSKEEREKTPQQLRKELKEALDNYTITKGLLDTYLAENNELKNSVRFYKAIATISKEDLQKFKDERDFLLIGIVELQNSDVSEIHKIAHKYLAKPTSERLFGKGEIDTIITNTSPWEVNENSRYTSAPFSNVMFKRIEASQKAAFEGTKNDA